MFALVSVDGGPPEVYADITTDQGYWRDGTTIEIACTAGLSWTWNGGAYLHTGGDAKQRLTKVFGLGAPVIGRCRDCAAVDDIATDATCRGPGVAIYCPHCGQRARVRLPQVTTVDDLR